MSQDEAIKVDPLREMKKLKMDLFRACSELRQAKDRTDRKSVV
jgi:hypothetical protein